jgi:hypothetical protein
MDALDEFFATWSEPEAWCEMCGEHPAIHVVLRDTEGKYGGIMSHVRVWDPATQSRIPVWRQCCKDQVELLGQSIKHAQSLEWPQPRRFPRISWPLHRSQLEWMQRLGKQIRLVVHHCLQRLWLPPG